jgi:transcriptional regulator with PAS, ATPase and Fis domain
MEAELFGYVAGAFTDAKRTTDGLIIAATGGVMFFDEIALLPMDLQAKLLRVIQERTVRKVGGKVEEAVDCKFVFATNRDLRSMVEDGVFMKDFYARISTLELKISPLRERKCDIIPITKSLPNGDAFLSKYSDELTSGVLDLSLNVRSIQQYVIRYAVLGRIKNEL